jgi:hypothetical protein
MVDADGYILRIATKEWADQVFNLAIYYTSTRRKWKPMQTVLFAHKTDVGDAFVGYGVIESIYEKDELSEDEKRECEKWGWKKALGFQYVVRFEKPLPIRETFIKDLRLRGRSLHGFPLTREQLNSIITQAEQLRSQAP